LVKSFLVQCAWNWANKKKKS